ncbi:hypothetical protein TNCV_1208801 [Trichonephila clavipes]|nr:hypothetical protein TNCV_1208801 [Trichonephila clavipes]
MFESSSYVNPTPLAHADTSRDVLPRGGTSQCENNDVCSSKGQRVFRFKRLEMISVLVTGSTKRYWFSNWPFVKIYEYYFAASKATDHDVVGDETENNSADPQILVVENHHINPPEEPEFMANTDY